MKRLLAVALAGGVIAVAAWALRGGYADAPPALVGTLSFSRPDLGDVFVVRAGGGHLRRLTSTRGPQFDPSFSPAGSRIVYRDSMVVRPDGSGERALGIRGVLPTWTAAVR